MLSSLARWTLYENIKHKLQLISQERNNKYFPYHSNLNNPISYTLTFQTEKENLGKHTLPQ
jgi:hypothetical protein